MFLLSSRVEWYIIWPWKVMLKIWPQVKVMTWPEKVMLHISRSAASAWTHLWCFHRSSWFLSKVIPEKLLVTFHDLKWPLRLDEGSPVTIFRLRKSILPVTRCFRVFWMVFVQKRRLSFFSHWLIMERSQNWHDLRSPISKFRDIRFIDTGTDINRWKFQGDRSFGVAMTNIQSFSEVRSLDVTWWPDLEWPGSEIFTKCAEKMYEQVYQKRSAAVFWIFAKKLRGGGVRTPPPPTTARVNLIYSVDPWCYKTTSFRELNLTY